MAPPTYLKPEIARERLIRILADKGISDIRVLDAFRKVPRHLFLDEALFEQAYDDNALPIGLKQTISQPYIVALMTQLLDINPESKILEIGTGSGFQAAVLSQFTRRVFTIERHRELGERARKKLRDMGYENIVFKIGDGTKGWLQHAPFDRIIVTAGAPVVPRDLINQLAFDGKLLIPTGERQQQRLELYHRKETVIEKSVTANVVFVPLVGEQGWAE